MPQLSELKVQIIKVLILLSSLRKILAFSQVSGISGAVVRHVRQQFSTHTAKDRTLPFKGGACNEVSICTSKL